MPVQPDYDVLRGSCGQQLAPPLCLAFPRMGSEGRPSAAKDARPVQGNVQDEDLQKFFASQNRSEAERLERLERLKYGPVPKSRLDRQREADQERHERDQIENEAAYQELLRDLETENTQRPGILGTRFVAKGGMSLADPGQAYVPPKPATAPPKRTADSAFATSETSEEPRKGRRGGLSELLAEIQR